MTTFRMSEGDDVREEEESDIQEKICIFEWEKCNIDVVLACNFLDVIESVTWIAEGRFILIDVKREKCIGSRMWDKVLN